MIRSKAIRQSARGETCTLRLDCCNANPETTVWCHSPFLTHGHGMGVKADDIFGCYGCSDCHDRLDGRVDPMEFGQRWLVFVRANAESLRRLVAKGIVKVAA